MKVRDKDSYLSEIYSGIQGEGPLLGIRQIFLRFCSCDLRCGWCDTPKSLVKTENCLIEEIMGKRLFKQVKNPISITNLLEYIKDLNPHKHHSFSLTGGEPLLQARFLVDFIPVLKEQYLLPVYLETGGHRPYELDEIIKYVDYISMDIKLPSSSNTGVLWEKHEKFLEVSLSCNTVKKIWVKIVVTENTFISEIEKATQLVKSIDKTGSVEILLQPVSKINNIFPPDELSLLEMQEKILNIYPLVRVIPQVHVLMGQR